MGMSAASTGITVRSEINIAPLVDIVLVLLIIFMIVIPLTQMGYGVSVPRRVVGLPAGPSDQLIVRLSENGALFINRERIAEKDFPARLREALKDRQSEMVFFAADGDLLYDRAAQFLDLCRDSGAKNIGIVFEDLAALHR